MPDHHPLFLRGIECFNGREYFDAHEAWETLWRQEQGPDKEFYQGLIQAAVALHHLRNGNMRGARNLQAGCRRHLASYRPRRHGVELEALLAQLDACVAGGPEAIPTVAPKIVLDPA